MGEQKRCSKCGVHKSLNEFYVRIASRDGLAFRCKECQKTERRDYWHTGRAKRQSHIEARRYTLQRKYGLSLQEYDAMLAAQHGVCAICLRKETRAYNGKILPLSVDHSHSTQKVRGLLCDRCNGLLAKAQDSTFILASASVYLLDADEYQEGVDEDGRWAEGLQDTDEGR